MNRIKRIERSGLMVIMMERHQLVNEMIRGSLPPSTELRGMDWFLPHLLVGIVLSHLSDHLPSRARGIGPLLSPLPGLFQDVGEI